jgi:WD40 repeat protein
VQLYLVISTDFKLHVLNEHLYHQREIPLKTRLINHCQFYDEQSQLVTAGVDGVLVFQFDVKRT